MWGKLRKETLEAARDARISGNDRAALEWLVCHSRVYDGKNLRKEHAGAVRAWLSENAHDAAPDGLQVVSMSHEQLRALMGSASEVTSRRAITNLIRSGVLIEARHGVKGKPGLYLIGPLEVRAESGNSEYDPYDDPPP